MVTFSTLHNVFVYSRLHLWLAYGPAVLVLTLIVIAGLVSTLRNGASFSDNFSTILRLSRGANLDTTISGDDLDGKDPLPRYLKRAKIAFTKTFPIKTHDKIEDTPVEAQFHGGSGNLPLPVTEAPKLQDTAIEHSTAFPPRRAFTN